MGWNSWNKFQCDVNERVVRDTADAMVTSGMRDAGYQYVVIDDCWQGKRDADGWITADSAKFPAGMKALADYVHSNGLKFGLYSDGGAQTCEQRPGSQGYEYQDALTYARWGVDYLKYDWCFSGTRNSEEGYSLMSDALRASGRDIVFSICEWGTTQPHTWAGKIGNLWRTTYDIRDAWSTGRWDNRGLGVIEIIEQNEPLHSYAGPEVGWNDADMLQVGNGSMTNAEYRSHFSLWALMASPLMAGNDLTHMSEATRDILTNKEVIAINQDPLGAQGRRVRDHGDLEVWSKQLSDGSRAVILFNRGDGPAEIAFEWTDIGYPRALAARVRDLWSHRNLGRKTGRYSAWVDPHGVVMIRVTP